MPNKEYKRPDEAKLLYILEENKYGLAETLIVLAWRLGLSREEIYGLKWADFSFEERQLSLPDRCIPLDEEAYQRLFRRWQGRGQRGEYVAANDRNGERVHANYIPRCVRLALNDGGLPDINMIDLRQDFVIRQLQEHPWPYVVKISGMTASTLFQRYRPYVQSERENREECAATSQGEETKLWAVIQKEGTSAEGLALRLSWQMGITLQDMVELTWEQVDFDKDVIRFNGERLQIPPDLKSLLLQVRASRNPDDPPRVLLSVKARNPIRAERLSVMVRTALIRGGVDNLTLADLLQKRREEEVERAILSIAEKTGKITKEEVMSQLQLTKNQAYTRLRCLEEKKKLVRVGTRYYLSGTIVAPEEHYEVICSYLEETGGAYRMDIAELLHLERRQCEWILAQFVKEGKLAKKGQRYMLPPGEATV